MKARLLRTEVTIDRSGSDAQYRFQATSFGGGPSPGTAGFAKDAVKPYQQWRQARFSASDLANPAICGDAADSGRPAPRVPTPAP